MHRILLEHPHVLCNIAERSLFNAGMLGLIHCVPEMAFGMIATVQAVTARPRPTGILLRRFAIVVAASALPSAGFLILRLHVVMVSPTEVS